MINLIESKVLLKTYDWDNCDTQKHGFYIFDVVDQIINNGKFLNVSS